MVWVFLVIIFMLIGGSLSLRVASYRNNNKTLESRASPLSLAITELIATSGGIYLAVVALTSFLRLDIPEKVAVFSVTMDPLAVSAIGAAVIQPFLTRIFNK